MRIHLHLSRILMMLFIASTTLTAGNKSSDIRSVTTVQDSNYTGRGNLNEVLLQSLVSINNSQAKLKKVVINLQGTTQLSDIVKINIYTTGKNKKFDSRNPEAVLLGSIKPGKGNLTVKTNHLLTSTDNYIWIT